MQKNLAFTANFVIPIYFKPDCVNLRYFKLRLFDLQNPYFDIAKVHDIYKD